MLTSPAGYRPTSLGYIVRIMAIAKIILFYFKSIHKCVSLSFYAHINNKHAHDDVALFLKCKHVDGCSFFEVTLQYMFGSSGG